MTHIKSWLIGAIFVSALLIFPSFLVFAAPIAVDDSATVDEDSSVLIDVLANDSDPDGDPLTIEEDSVTDPEHGTAIKEGNKVRYTPDEDYYGTDSFSYTVTDGTDTATATVTVTVNQINDAPVAVDDVVTTLQDTPVSFTLRATDVDIDPTTPYEEHPLVFQIISAPAHGELSGDLTDVYYELPHTAYIEVTYTPDEGYTGNDSITFTATDPFDLYDSAVVELVVGKREMGTLAGTLDASITMEGQPFDITGLKASLTGIYRLGDFETRVTPVWDIDSFSSLTIKAEIPLGELATVRSTLSFDPDDSQYFDYWRTLTRFSFSDINLAHTFYLPEDSDSSYHQIAARARIEDISVTSTTKFTGCEAAFDEQVFTGNWRWTECDLSLYARLSIECDGFEEFSLTVRDIPIVQCEDEEFGITLRIETTFTTTTKTIEPTFTCRTNWLDCFKIRCEVVTAEDSDMSIAAISIYGLQFKTTFSDGITLRMDTSLVEEKNSTMTGYSDYFEKWMLSGPVIACCGSSGRWQATTYFQSSETDLFGWGMSTFKLEAPLAEQFLVSTEFSFQPDEPHWEWICGWKLHW
jgi:hypothetical protein